MLPPATILHLLEKLKSSISSLSSKGGWPFTAIRSVCVWWYFLASFFKWRPLMINRVITKDGAQGRNEISFFIVSEQVRSEGWLDTKLSWWARSANRKKKSFFLNRQVFFECVIRQNIIMASAEREPEKFFPFSWTINVKFASMMCD